MTLSKRDEILHFLFRIRRFIYSLPRQQQVNFHPTQPGVVDVCFPILGNVIPLHYKYEVYTYNLANILQASVPHYTSMYHNIEPVGDRTD